MTPTKKLRELLAQGKLLVAPGAHDALTARVIEKCGFEAVYMTGYGQAASHLGRPDVGLICFSEMLDRAQNTVEATALPVIADADTGFGNAVNVIRTVRAYQKAGVAAIQLEDQVSPKRCGHMVGREVVAKEDMIGKIKAAVDARFDPDFMIIARTDARTVLGIDEALDRAKAYEAAGADIIFVESPESAEEMKAINTAITKAYTLANMVEGGRTPLLPNNELEAMGYNLVIYPTASTYLTTKAMFNLMNTLKKDGTTKNMIDQMVTFTEFNDLIGLTDINALGAKYGHK
ncbi:isocitrate lyase/phosphoenolpyruvate mutase family protein [Deltaproteobacteria bacterium OttesenSCG-928-M10]|nr:isocitrate lyase/phosphoenolpyruvate mutase family protein [Deltaproteobacteria bacterium OttesenSCG-928-M10]